MIEGLQDVIKADSARATKMDCVASVEEYINKSDWRINANANTGYSAAGLVNNLAGKAIANYWLDKVYTKKEGDAHRNGDYHIHDLDILVVEDIIDSGKTLSKLKAHLAERGAHSVKICTLLDKPSRREVDLTADYCGAQIPDKFVIGYGLDYDEKYRNLPYVGVLSPKVYM